jgi:hypothetical protein
LGLILIFNGGYSAFGQRYKLAVGTGRLQLYVFSSLTDDTDRLLFPREYEIYSLESPEFTPRVSKGGGIIITAKDFKAKAFYKDENPDPANWTIEDSLFSYFAVDATSWFTVDVQHSTVPVPPGALRYWKIRPTVRIIYDKKEGSNINFSIGDWIEGRDFDGPLDMPTNQMGLARCHTSMGITVTERTWMFDQAEFAIVEYIFKYTGETGNSAITYSDPITDCYVGIKFCPIVANSKVVKGSTGWGTPTDDWIDYVHEENGDKLRVMYGWDGDASDMHQTVDDEGDPLYFSSGLFAATQYPGMAVLHADKSTTDHTDDQDQPHHFHVSSGGYESSNTLSIGRLSFQNIYKILDESSNTTSPFDWLAWKAAGSPADDSQFWTYGTSHADEERRYSQIGTLAFGPYTFNPGDSVHIVLSYAVGTIDWKTAIDLGAQWKEFSIDKQEKNKTLRSGRDSLFSKIKRIKELFEPNFQTNYDLNNTLQFMADKLDRQPAWPDSVTCRPVIFGCRISWSPVENSVAYRIYRRDRIDFDPAEPDTNFAYSLVYQCGGEDPGGSVKYSPTIDSTVWIDTKVYPLRNYWYYVTSMNSNGIESSHFIGRTNPLPDDDTYGSIQPFEQEYITLEDVHVIPNPYHVKALKLYSGFGEDELLFLGLPAFCRIRIFTLNGHLIFSDKHKSGVDFAANRYDWNMRTSMDQTVASGVYVYVIDQCKDFHSDEINATKVGKFVVIR